MMQKKGFTLVELLVVIAIMLLLAGILLPVLHAVRRNAARATAREDVYQLVTAWKTYLNDYRRFPEDNVDIMEMDADTIAIMNSSTNIQAFIMEFTNVQRTNGFRDPWGGLYQVALDRGRVPRDTGAAYDGEVTPPHGTIFRSVVAWSLGPNGRDDTESAREDDVKSWR